MDIVFYVIIFIVGAILGSFCARTIHRIAKEKKVFAIHSYCANCGKKLNFFEKIPILSYIFLRGKCKQCKKKIDYNYIILEVMTGMLLLVAAYGLKPNITNLISFIFIALYFSYIILVIGLDKKGKNMSASVLAYGITIALAYIMYSCIVEKTSIYANILYLIMMTILLLLNIINTKKRAQSSYVLDLLTTLLIMLIFTGKMVCILTIAGTLISIALYILINKVKKAKGQKGKTAFASNIKMVYIMGILNVLIFLALINIFR